MNKSFILAIATFILLILILIRLENSSNSINTFHNNNFTKKNNSSQKSEDNETPDDDSNEYYETENNFGENYISEYTDFIKTLTFDTLEILKRPKKFIPKPKNKIRYKIIKMKKQEKTYYYDVRIPEFISSSNKKAIALINYYIKKKVYDWLNYFKEEIIPWSIEQYNFHINDTDKIIYDETFFLHYLKAFPTVKQVSDKILTVYYYWSQFEGGAHGMYAYFGYNFDLETGELINPFEILDFNDKVNQMICWFIRRRYNTSKIPINPSYPIIYDNYPRKYFDPYEILLDNFRITNKGLEIWYQVYEIASFGEGTQFHFVPWNAIEEFVNKEIINLK